MYIFEIKLNGGKKDGQFCVFLFFPGLKKIRRFKVIIWILNWKPTKGILAGIDLTNLHNVENSLVQARLIEELASQVL